MSEVADWPLVSPNDDGLRETVKPGECFYCGGKVGEAHGLKCVIVNKKIRVRYIFEFDTMVPHFWGSEEMREHYDTGDLLKQSEQSSWCADNALAELAHFAKEKESCLCPVFTCEYVKIVDATPVKLVQEGD